MSSTKRRAKRKIAQLVRMEQTRFRYMRWAPGSKHAAFVGCMRALGLKLTRMGLRERAMAALRAAGTDMK